MKTRQLRSTLILSALSVGACLTTFQTMAQVKIGSNPTTISANANLQAEAANAAPFIVQKDNGYLGVNTLTPATLAHISANSAAQGLRVDLQDGTSSIYASADGALTVTRVGASKPFAPHIGGYLDLVGQVGSPGWRIGQYGAFLGVGPQGSSNFNGFPLYIHNDSYVTMGNATRMNDALLSVYGQLAANGFSTRPGVSGVAPGNSFNINWTGTVANLYIDDVNLGAIQTTSDYRLKKNVSAMQDRALQRVKMLRPVSFEYKNLDGELFRSDLKVHEGFIAHELQAVVPSAVTGQKDALTKDGKIQPQTLNPFPVISLLTKAVQEQQQQIEALQSENLALKSQTAKLDVLTARLAEIESKLRIADNANGSASVEKTR